MVTNSKEYMREYQRARRAKIKKDVKNVKNNVKNLHPPRAPRMVDTSGGHTESGQPSSVAKAIKDSSAGLQIPESQTIDFSYLTNNSSFQRAIMEFIRRFVPGLENIKVRGNKEVMKQSFNVNVNNYRNVMEELKAVLEARKK